MTNESTTDSTSVKPSRTRSYILFGVLGVMIIALAYDYKVARPKVEQAYEELVLLNIHVNADPTDKVTPEMVSKALGKSPSRTFRDVTDVVEVYSWRGGLFFRTHDLYVAYRETPLGTLMARTSKFRYDDHMAVYEDVYARLPASNPFNAKVNARFEDPAAGLDPELMAVVSESDPATISLAIDQPSADVPTVKLALQE